jgi:hypothetical protein
MPALPTSMDELVDKLGAMPAQASDMLQSARAQAAHRATVREQRRAPTPIPAAPIRRTQPHRAQRGGVVLTPGRAVAGDGAEADQGVPEARIALHKAGPARHDRPKLDCTIVQTSGVGHERLRRGGIVATQLGGRAR